MNYPYRLKLRICFMERTFRCQLSTVNCQLFHLYSRIFTSASLTVAGN